MKKLVIFDLDGTLLNTIDDLGEATNHALASLGFPTHPLTAYPAYVGNGVRRLMQRALPDESSPETIAAMLERFKEYYDEHCCDRTVPYPGIPELLARLSDADVNLAVASNKYQKAVEAIVPHFFPGIHWVALEGQKSGVPVKPDPSIVFEILTKCPTPKADVLYVGDSGVDIETARRACVDNVGVTWGYRPAKELRARYADRIVDNPVEIFDIVQSGSPL
ncbi:MAG: HAD family hydrolase [Duncaniella sp.]|nr:HAD family hydrolase [Duncaniella sp.]